MLRTDAVRQRGKRIPHRPVLMTRAFHLAEILPHSFQRYETRPFRRELPFKSSLHPDGMPQYIRQHALLPRRFVGELAAARKLRLIKRQNFQRLPRILETVAQRCACQRIIIRAALRQVIRRPRRIHAEQQVVMAANRRVLFGIHAVAQPPRIFLPFANAAQRRAIGLRCVIDVFVIRQLHAALNLPLRILADSVAVQADVFRHRVGQFGRLRRLGKQGLRLAPLSVFRQRCRRVQLQTHIVRILPLHGLIMRRGSGIIAAQPCQFRLRMLTQFRVLLLLRQRQIGRQQRAEQRFVARIHRLPQHGRQQFWVFAQILIAHHDRRNAFPFKCRLLFARAVRLQRLQPRLLLQRFACLFCGRLRQRFRHRAHRNAQYQS